MLFANSTAAITLFFKGIKSKVLIVTLVRSKYLKTKVNMCGPKKY